LEGLLSGIRPRRTIDGPSGCLAETPVQAVVEARAADLTEIDALPARPRTATRLPRFA
jgi:hypothetical protein